MYLIERKKGDIIMVQEKNIALCIILSIITCGIYGIYWFVVLTDDVNKVSETENGTTGGMAFLFSIITCGIYTFYWMYKQGEKLDAAKAKRGQASSNSGILYLILNFIGLGIVSYALMQNELNKMSSGQAA